MAIRIPSAYGLIVRKSAKTRARVAREVDYLRTHYPDLAEEELNQDEHLFGYSIAQGSYAIDATLEELREQGWVRGEDFVVTSAITGVLDPMPAWLAATVVPTGEPSEPDDFRAMLERTQSSLYSYVEPQQR